MSNLNKTIFIALLSALSLAGFNKKADAHSVQVAYCANCSKTLRIFFEHWHGCTVNPQTSGTISISIKYQGKTNNYNGYPQFNLCNIPLASLPGCNTPPTRVGGCASSQNKYNDWWVYDFPAAPCGATITITATAPSNAYTADCGGLFPLTWSFKIPCNVNKPFANFKVLNDSICVGTAMNFQDLSTGGNPGLNYTWDFGDGGTSTSASPSHTYASAGNYCVKLTTQKVTGGCTDDTTICVTVLGTPAITIPGDTACTGYSGTLNASCTPGGGTYSWSPGGQTTPSITVTPAATTTYTLNYVAPSGCSGSGTGTITVAPSPTADFTFDSVCFGNPTTFTDKSTIGSGSISGWQWDFGDGSGTSTSQNPTYTYGTPGTYTVRLIITTALGCIDSISYSVPVSTPVNAGFMYTTVCLNDSTMFTDTSTSSMGVPSVWDWYFGDGNTSTQQNPGHVYGSPGTYNVKLVVGTGPTCKDSVTKTVDVYDMPVPNFTFTDQCAKTAVNFNNTSNIGSGSISGYVWDFGDTSGTSTTTSPSHTYTNPGTFPVKLIATSNNGCIDSITQNVTIYALPVTDFTFDSVCLGNQTCFTDLTTVQNSNVSGWQWVFGDGSPTDTTSNPCHTYATAGSFNVTLITKTAQGCTGTQNYTVPVNALPIADFSTANVCQADAAMFKDLSTIPADSIVNWQWDFGNGSGTSTQKNPSYQYPSSGTYTVQLIALPPAGYACADTVTKQINIYPMPTADFNFTNVCFEDTTTLTDLSNVNPGSIASWQWDLGDSQNSSSQNVKHRYGKEGNYQVELIVTTDSGCTDTISKQIAVYGKPVVDFTPTSVCEGVNTQFRDQSTLNFGQFQTWIWSFGDNSSNQSGQNTSHLYGASGSYSTTLIVTTTDGCIDSANKTVYVNPLPVVDFVADRLDGCEPVCPNFTDQTTISSGGIASYSWDFGDGGVAGSANPSHCYENKSLSPKSFDVTLTATSDSGCVTTVTKTNYISAYPYPIAEFTTDDDVVKISDPFIQFFDKSRGNYKWVWDFGDGDQNITELSPTHQYKDTGRFISWLYIENQWGCRDSTVKLLEVEPEFFIYIPNAFTPDEDYINDTWYPKVFGVDEMDTYIFDRWGELIWEGHELDSKWDGMYKGKGAKQDVYVYLVKVLTFQGELKEYRGKVTLLK